MKALMSTTTVRMKVYERSPFGFIETKQVLRLAFRIERSLENSRARVRPERFEELKRKLRATIDALADASQALMEEGE